MKRQGQVIEKMIRFDNLLLAYYKAAKGKRHLAYVQDFESELDTRIGEIQDWLSQGLMPPGDYRNFTIYDPKERVITVAPFSHRVIHHAIMNVCGDKFDHQQFFHSYACRRYKGSHAAVKWVQTKMFCGNYYLKLDIRKYFDSVEHAILLQQLERLFKDRVLIRLFEDVVAKGSPHPGKGLPIGNLTSQFFANHYLACFDRWIKQEQHQSKYVRYMDDMLILGLSKEAAKELRDASTQFLRQHLNLVLKVSQINDEGRGIPFLGYRVFRHQLKLTPRSKRRFVLSWKKLDALLVHGSISESLYHKRMQAIFEFAGRAEIGALKRKILNEK